jgi:large subunit ribosomal protein L11
MVKKVQSIIKIQLPAGKANPAPPVGTALGPHGINIADFCQKFNAATKEKGEDLIPVEITIYEDRSFDFILKTPPVAYLIKKAIGIEKGSSDPQKKKVGKISKAQIDDIVKKKMEDLNTDDLQVARKIVEGTAKSMGVKVE